MRRTFFEYCIDNYMLIVGFTFAIALDVIAALEESIIGVSFFTFTFVFTLICAIIDWRKHG